MTLHLSLKRQSEGSGEESVNVVVWSRWVLASIKSGVDGLDSRSAIDSEPALLEFALSVRDRSFPNGMIGMSQQSFRASSMELNDAITSGLVGLLPFDS